jgi:hypothetical protein
MNQHMLFKNYTKKLRKYLSKETEAGDSANGPRCLKKSFTFLKRLVWNNYLQNNNRLCAHHCLCHTVMSKEKGGFAENPP